MNKIETAFCKRLKEVYPEEIQRDMDINYHVKGQNGKSCTIFGEKNISRIQRKVCYRFWQKGAGIFDSFFGDSGIQFLLLGL